MMDKAVYKSMGGSFWQKDWAQGSQIHVECLFQFKKKSIVYSIMEMVQWNQSDTR